MFADSVHCGALWAPGRACGDSTEEKIGTGDRAPHILTVVERSMFMLGDF